MNEDLLHLGPGDAVAQRAAQAVEWVNPKQVVPMHFGTYAILAGTPAQFKAALDKRGLGARMVEMKPGETRSY